jgi:hypothetical protein
MTVSEALKIPLVDARANDLCNRARLLGLCCWRAPSEYTHEPHISCDHARGLCLVKPRSVMR